MINFLASIFGAIIRAIYNLVGGNYGLSIILFTILTKIILFPINYKQTKAMEDMQKLAPLEKEIREKYKGNKEKQNEELYKAYQEHKVNPMAGCLPLLIQFPIIIAMFYIVRQPLTYIVQIPEEQITEYAKEELGKDEVSDSEVSGLEIRIAGKKNLLNMRFLNVDFGAVPSDSLNNELENRPSKLTLIIPILSIVFQWLQVYISQKRSKMTEEQLQQQKTMNILMPILSGWISYKMPLALGIYWLLGNILAIISQEIINFLIKEKKIMIGGS